MKKLILLFTVAILFSALHVSAQSFSDRFFMSRGMEIIVASGPASLSPVYSKESTDDSWTESNEQYGIFYSGYFLGYRFVPRYNLLEMSDELSLSASLPVALGLTVWTDQTTSGAGFGSIHIPLFLEINYGNGATYSSSSNLGLVAGVGVQWDIFPLIATNDYTDYSSSTKKYEVPSVKKSWIHPTVELGVRYWSRNNKLREINLRYGFSSKTEWTDENGEIVSDLPFNFQIAFIRVMNY